MIEDCEGTRAGWLFLTSKERLFLNPRASALNPRERHDSC